MKLLLLGGTGAMGAYLARLLADRGDEAHVTTRSDRTGDGIIYIKGDAHDNAFVGELLKDRYDAVVDFMVYHTEEFRQRVGMMLANTGQYVYFSSSRVYADSASPITEDSPRLLDVCMDLEYLATDEYALTKARQEDLLRESGRANWTIVRPYITYATGRLQLGTMEKEAWLRRALRGKSIVFAKDVAAHMTTLTYGLDVARAIASLLGNKSALGTAVHIAGAPPIRWADVLNIYLDVLEERLGKRPNVVMLDDSSKMWEALHNEYQTRYDRLYDRVFDNSLANRLCGEISYTPPEEGLRACLGEFLDGDRKFGSSSWLLDGWADRLCGERTPLREAPGLKNRVKYFLGRYLGMTRIRR